jgi:PleD family two-component response regulator
LPRHPRTLWELQVDEAPAERAGGRGLRGRCGALVSRAAPRRLRHHFRTGRHRVRVALSHSHQASGVWQIVVCDHGLPNFSSTEALRVVRETGLDIPFVILSGTIGEEAAVEPLKAGVRDVVLKTNLARLGPVVDRELREAENRRRQEHLESERAELQTSLRHQAVHDALTGLPNRVLALDRARQMLARARRQPFTVAALYVDLDGFKQVNDGFGHAAGDGGGYVVADGRVVAA